LPKNSKLRCSLLFLDMKVAVVINLREIHA